MSSKTRDENAKILDQFVKTLKFVRDTTYQSKEASQQHLVAKDVPLRKVIDTLIKYRFEDLRDSASFTGLLATLGEAIRTNQNLVATIYQMRPAAKGIRSVNKDGTIENYLQGRTDRPGGYPGDTTYLQEGQLSMQLHAYDLRSPDDKQVIARAAPLVVTHLPSALAKAWLLQNQAGQV